MPALMRFQDVGELSSREKTPEGFLMVVADFARVGIQDYHAGEFRHDELPAELQGDPLKIIKMLRPEAEVFNKASMKSFAHKPITDGHPPEFVDAKNFREFGEGLTQGNVTRQGFKLRVGMTFHSAPLIQRVEDGEDQLSAGYDAQIVWGPGTDPVHGHFDAKQINIQGNHIAVVDKARGGPEVRINDSWPKATPTKDDKPMADELKKKINGISVAFSDQGAQAVDFLVAETEKVKGERDALQAQLTDAKAKRDTLQGEFDALKANQLTDAQVEVKAAERTKLIDRAKKLHPKLEDKGLSLQEIKTKTIQHVDSKSFDLEGKSADYVDAVFDTLAAKAPSVSTNSLDNVFADASFKGFEDEGPAAKAKAAHDKRTQDAWKFGKGATQ